MLHSFSCAPRALSGRASLTRRPFGTLPDGQKVTAFTLTNARGLSARILDYGGIIAALRVPDARGHCDDIVLGYDSLDGYARDTNYFGALIGRYGNRIARGQFALDGHEYQLATNNGPNHLHGGLQGFNRKMWRAHPLLTREGVALELRLLSPDGDQGYPGALDVRVIYTLSDANQLRLEYRATCDAPTVLNLTNHSYFNLAGAGNGLITGHTLRLYANRFTPIDATAIPLGDARPVAGTPFDFRTPHAIGARINAPDEQLRNGQGYDHNFVLDGRAGRLRLAARAESATSGRVMRVYTTQPGVQFYSGNFLNGETGKGGRPYERRSGFCLETQHFPDSPHHPQFPSTVLRPGQIYRQETIYEFSSR